MGLVVSGRSMYLMAAITGWASAHIKDRIKEFKVWKSYFNISFYRLIFTDYMTINGDSIKKQQCLNYSCTK